MPEKMKEYVIPPTCTEWGESERLLKILVIMLVLRITEECPEMARKCRLSASHRVCQSDIRDSSEFDDSCNTASNANDSVWIHRGS